MFGLPMLSAPKIIGFLILAAAIFGGGFYSGKIWQDHEDHDQISNLQKELADTKLDWEAYKTEVAQAQAEAASAVANALAENQKKVRAVEDAAQAQIAKVTADLNSKMKKVKDEAEVAIYKATHPVLSGDPVDDGLWVDAYDCSGGTATGENRVPQTTSGTVDQPVRCRLHPSTAERLIQSATAANQVVEELNACVASLKVLSPQSFAPPNE